MTGPYSLDFTASSSSTSPVSDMLSSFAPPNATSPIFDHIVEALAPDITDNVSSIFVVDTTLDILAQRRFRYVESGLLRQAAETTPMELGSLTTDGPTPRVYVDDVTTSIEVGGGASHNSTVIGASGTALNINNEFLIDATTLESLTGDLTISTGSDQLSIRSSGVDTPINAPGDTTFNSYYGDVSLIEAVNTLLRSHAKAITANLDDGSGAGLDEGTVVYVPGTGEVNAADASSDNAASLAVGVTYEDISASGTGEIATEGVCAVRFEAGEGVGPHAGSVVYLSETEGYGTLTAPSGSGSVVHRVGTVLDTDSYDTGAGGIMQVVLQIGAERRVNE